MQSNLKKREQERYVVPIKDLSAEEHGAVICYPGTDLSDFAPRVKQLKENGVEEIILEGTTKIGKYGVVGRGCVSTVVKAKLGFYPDIVALKIRRVDANRTDMIRDFELQKYANSFGVGPKAILATKDLFAMEYIPAIKIGKWFRSLKTRTPKKIVRSIVRDSLEQCYLLDSHNLDHGELSNPSKHILIRQDTKEVKTVIIDFESSSAERRPSNVTAVAQFFLLSSGQSKKVRKILGHSKARNELSKRKVISLLRNYKQNPTREAFQDLFDYLGL